jgi:hypothetical protein
LELGLNSGEELINILMCMTNDEEAEVDILEDVKGSEQTEEGKNISIFVLSIAIVSLDKKSVRTR